MRDCDFVTSCPWHLEQSQLIAPAMSLIRTIPDENHIFKSQLADDVGYSLP